jgi:hypothetical protein
VFRLLLQFAVFRLLLHAQLPARFFHRRGMPKPDWYTPCTTSHIIVRQNGRCLKVALPHPKLVLKAGPSGSRIQRVPGIRCPRFLTIVSSIIRYKGPPSFLSI